MMKKLTAMLFVAIMILALALGAGLAEETVLTMEGTFESGSVEGGISNEAAIEGFINRAFGIGGTKRAGETRGSRLEGQNAIVYAYLRDRIAEVAAGQTGSTVFNMPVSAILTKLSYTAEELGVPAIVENSAIAAAAKNAMYAKFTYDTPLIMDCLMADCPYELYWFDKTVGYSYGTPGISAKWNGSEYEICFADEASLHFDMKVAKEYSVTDAQGTTDFNTDVATKISTAVENADSIVTSNSGKSDYAKLKAYKDEICALVDYNNAAANDNNHTPYGNPWQLIWVFDGKSETKVVCEGYAKAFKYLCDKSTFRTAVSAAIAMGNMIGGTGAGPHMWNIVTMGNGKKYLVDVTNCDEGTTGAPDQLFMAGYTSRYQGEDGDYGYVYTTTGGQITYVYESEIRALYSAEELAMSETAFALSDDPAAGLAPGSKLEPPVITNVVPGDLIGADFTAEVSLPETAAGGWAELCIFDTETDRYVSLDPWFELSSGSNMIRILGFNFDKPGSYQLRARAWTHDEYTEEPQEGDSEWATVEFVRNGTALAAAPAVQLSATTVEFDGVISYTVPGADAVTYSLYGLDTGGGIGLPASYTTGETETVRCFEPGNTRLTIWARFDGLWSQPAEEEVYAVPLGTVSAPELSWNGYAVDDSLKLAQGDPMAFTARASGLDYLWYELMEDDGEVLHYLTDGGTEESTLSFDLADAGLAPGMYRLEISGQTSQRGWLCEPKVVWLTVTDGALFKVTDGKITEYTGSATVTDLVIPGAFEGQTITAIGEFAFEGMKQLKSVTLPETLTRLETGAFLNCGLTSVKVPAGTATNTWYFYEPSAGYEYPRVYSVALPAAVTWADASFLACGLPDMQPDFVTPDGLTEIGAEAFSGTKPRFVWLTDDVSRVGSGAFAGCSGLLVRVPDGCAVGENAFPQGTVIFTEWSPELSGGAGQNGYTLNGFKYYVYVEGFNG